jgi:hypothetical protein
MKSNKSRIWVSPKARMLGRKLIQRLQVRRGHGIAEYLGVEHFYTNYEAVYLWIDQMLASQSIEFLTEEDI